jgi:thioredoxin-related protein
MKKFLLILLFLPFVGIAQDSSAVETNLEWVTDYNQAVKQAKKERKNILLYFTGSDWCSPCIQLKRDLFDTREFQDISKKFVLLYIDHPRNQDLLTDQEWKQTKSLMSRYNKRGSFPLLQVLNSRGKTLDEISGYSGTGVISYYMEMIQEHS